jgi:hypothetical protein
MPERLITLARQRIAERSLPANLPERTFGGVSAGGICALCSEPIERKSLEIETESHGAPVFAFHPPCFAAWMTAVGQGSESAPQQVT